MIKAAIDLAFKKGIVTPGNKGQKKRSSVRLATFSINDSCKMKTLSIIRDFLPNTESLASENASRLAAMQCAEKNIDELLDGLNGTR